MSNVGRPIDEGWLGESLKQLATHLRAVSGEAEVGVAAYDAAGVLLAKGGSGPFPPRASGAGTPDSATATVPVEGSRESGRRGRRIAFVALRCAAGGDPDALQALARLAAWTLAREAELLRQAARLRQLLLEQRAITDHVSDGLMVVDRTGELRYMNGPAGRILDLDPEASTGRPLRELLDFEPIIAPVFETGMGYVDREMQIDSRRKLLHVMDTAVPIRGEDGNVVSIVNTFRDMSKVRRLSHQIAGDRARYRFSDIIGEAPPFQEAVAAARRAARSNANVLILGESGTGKELFAQAIHTGGPRRNEPFVAVNCAALPRDLIESELFGYVAGSFTGADRSGRPGKFELASSGTIFLDEISEMPLDVQAKLLRVLQERQATRIGGTRSFPLDVRVVAAANRDVRALVASGLFREDLYYRLNVIRIAVPALRERRQDVPRLAQEMMSRGCAVLHRSTMTLSEHALEQLVRHDWPGNVRQLQNIVERLVNMVDDNLVTEVPPAWLSDSPDPKGPRPGAMAVEASPKPASLKEAERTCIQLTLEAAGFNITRAAALLGITRSTLYAKMRRHRLTLALRLATDGASPSA